MLHEGAQKSFFFFFPSIKSSYSLVLFNLLLYFMFFSGFAGAPEKQTRVEVVALAKSATVLPLISVQLGLLTGWFSELN